MSQCKTKFITLTKLIRRTLVISALPIFLILVLISPLVRIRFARLQNARFGHLLMNSERYLCRLHSSRRAVSRWRALIKIDLIFAAERFWPNEGLKEMVQDQLPLIPGWLVYPFWVWSVKLKAVRLQIPEIETDMYDFDNLIADNSRQLKIKPSREARAQLELEKFGFSPEQKYVCAFVRTSSYLKNNVPSYASIEHLDEFRNGSFDVLHDTLRLVVEHGFKVVVMGKESGHQFSELENNLREHLFVREKHKLSDYADLMLGRDCEFFISTPSGAENSADIIGRKPVLNFDVNTICNQAVYLPNKLSIFKRQYSLRLGRFLTLAEIIEIGSHRFLFAHQFAKAEIRLIPNSAADIRGMVKEFLFLKNNNWNRSLLPSRGNLGLELNRMIGKDIPLGYSGYRCPLDNRMIRYSESFLEKYKNEFFWDYIN